MSTKQYNEKRNKLSNEFCSNNQYGGHSERVAFEAKMDEEMILDKKAQEALPLLENVRFIADLTTDVARTDTSISCAIIIMTMLDKYLTSSKDIMAHVQFALEITAEFANETSNNLLNRVNPDNPPIPPRRVV